MKQRAVKYLEEKSRKYLFLMKYLIPDVLAVDLLEKMLVLDTDKRITAADSLAHSYFAQYHDPDDEPEAEPFDQSFESRELDIEEWKRESMVSALFIRKMPKSALSNFSCFDHLRH